MNIQQSLLFFFLIILTVSCKKEKQLDLPYEEEKVILILSDMHFAKSAAMIHKVEERDSMKLIYDDQVFKIHGITKEDYENLKLILDSDLNRFYEIEKKVHKHLKSIQNDNN